MANRSTGGTGATPRVMASDWLRLKVSLVSGRGEEFEPSPGRMMIAAPEHTLAELAEAIDLGFARWDHSHHHLFELLDGRSLMSGEESAGADGSDGGTDRSTLGVARLDAGPAVHLCLRHG